MSRLPNKRETLQVLLDEIEPGWQIKKPSPVDPYDVEYACIFQKPSEYKEATAWIPNTLFQDGPLERVREILVDSVRKARIVG